MVWVYLCLYHNDLLHTILPLRLDDNDDDIFFLVKFHCQLLSMLQGVLNVAAIGKVIGLNNKATEGFDALKQV